MAFGQRARRKGNDEWNEQWPRIKAMHDRNCDLEWIAAEMELLHGFSATPRQYKTQFEKKGKKKYLKKEELKEIVAHDLWRQEQGKKSSRYSARKKAIGPRELKRHMKEFGTVEPSNQKPKISYFECKTSQYDLDNPHIQELIRGQIEPYRGYDKRLDYDVEGVRRAMGFGDSLSSCGQGLASTDGETLQLQDVALWDSIRAITAGSNETDEPAQPSFDALDVLGPGLTLQPTSEKSFDGAMREPDSVTFEWSWSA